MSFQPLLSTIFCTCLLVTSNTAFSENSNQDNLQQGNRSPSQLGQLKNAVGLCLDAFRSTSKNKGGNVVVWRCDNGRNQMWTRDGNKLVNGNGLCLDAFSSTNSQKGGNVVVWTCDNQQNPNQMWIKKGNKLVNGKGLCLDAFSNTNTIDGGNVVVWTCDNQQNPNQSWKRLE